jgi:hypothetical protein
MCGKQLNNLHGLISSHWLCVDFYIFSPWDNNAILLTRKKWVPPEEPEKKESPGTVYIKELAEVNIYEFWNTFYTKSLKYLDFFKILYSASVTNRASKAPMESRQNWIQEWKDKKPGGSTKIKCSMYVSGISYWIIELRCLMLV